MRDLARREPPPAPPDYLSPQHEQHEQHEQDERHERREKPQHQKPRRHRRRTGWLVLVAVAVSGALAVLALAGVYLTRWHHAHAHARAAVPPVTQSMPATMSPYTLLGKLTTAVEAGNETAFLSMVAPSAQPAVRLWWENLQAIGFTTGVIMPAGADSVTVDSHGDGTMTVLAGVHSPLDAQSGNGTPDIGCEQYQIGIHFAGITATGEITSWRPLGDAPWDQGVRLDVRKASNVVVAGPAADSKIVNQTLPIAQAAASYDIGLLGRVGKDDLHQLGFVMFVSGNAAVRDSWFSTGPQPAGWPPAYDGGLSFPLPGVAASAGSAGTAGARIVITPHQDDGQNPHGETAQLVRQFMLAALAPDEGTGDGTDESAAAPWAVQGIAVAVQELYLADASPAPAHTGYSWNALTSAIRGLPADFRAPRLPLPGRQQLFTGAPRSQRQYNVLAASVYEYIAIKYGMNQMLVSAVQQHYSAQVMAGWRTWLDALLARGR
jgi:hypothetical protein